MHAESSSYPTLEIPPEVSGPIPRKVGLNFDGDGRFLLIIILCFFIPGLIFLGWNGYGDFNQFQHRAVLRNNAREVVGEVTGFSWGRYSPISVHYRFAVDGATYSGKALEPKSPGPGTSYSKGDDILIRFLPSNPTVNHPGAWEWSPTDGWYFVLAEVFFTSLGGVVLAYLLRDRKLARKGKVAAAMVTACTRDDRWFRVEYEFRTEDGVLMKGHDDFKDEYGVGARIWMLYLPQRPQRNHRYPLSTFIVVQ